jgi:hypothetical protein
MALIYGVVARGGMVLAEYPTKELASSLNAAVPPGVSEAQKIARFILTEKVAKEPGPHKKSFGHQKHNFHYKVDDTGICYLVAVQKGPSDDSTSSVRIPYKCIEEIASEFLPNCGSLVDRAGEGGLNDVFSRVIQEKLAFWNNPEADTILKAKQKVDVVKDQIRSNISSLEERGKALNSLEERSTLLVDEAADLKTNATTMQRTLWWKQKRCQVIMCVSCVVRSFISLFLLF